MIETITSLFGTSSMNALIKTGGAVLTVLLVVPALFKLLIVTIDEGEAAIRTRNGRPIVRRRARGGHEAGEVVVLGPGTHAVFPVLAWYRRVDTRVRSTDLPARQLTSSGGRQHLVHASFDWRPYVTGGDLRVFELEVVHVTERTGNLVGAALRDLVHSHEGTRLPVNVDLSAAVVGACAERVREACGIELLSVVITGDALTDGYLLADAITRQATDRAPEAVPQLWASAVAARHSA
ncbi:MAG: SPFH domain-containing protein [Microbacterium hominis]|uniref:SPFH domain-containing protein n=1 Tax=Microbacterium aurum TaxID=36805 RepID=UPI00248DBDBE|nr:SPFH domain-containing protein [Microbacterium aurum]MBZ6372110.1 SPFH domain-containing protein [Microbacterium hominis]